LAQLFLLSMQFEMFRRIWDLLRVQLGILFRLTWSARTGGGISSHNNVQYLARIAEVLKHWLTTASSPSQRSGNNTNYSVAEPYSPEKGMVPPECSTWGLWIPDWNCSSIIGRRPSRASLVTTWPKLIGAYASVYELLIVIKDLVLARRSGLRSNSIWSSMR